MSTHSGGLTDEAVVPAQSLGWQVMLHGARYASVLRRSDAMLFS